MATHWSAEEHKTLESLLADGVELELLKKHLLNRSYDALHRQVQKYGYGVNTVNGVKRLYDGKKTRVHTKKVEEATEDASKIDSRTALTVQEPTITSESTDKNLTDDIVTDSKCNFNRDAFLHLYDDVGKLLNSDQYALKSITVTLNDTVLKICRGAI